MRIIKNFYNLEDKDIVEQLCLEELKTETFQAQFTAYKRTIDGKDEVYATIEIQSNKSKEIDQK